MVVAAAVDVDGGLDDRSSFSQPVKLSSMIVARVLQKRQTDAGQALYTTWSRESGIHPRPMRSPRMVPDQSWASQKARAVAHACSKQRNIFSKVIQGSTRGRVLRIPKGVSCCTHRVQKLALQWLSCQAPGGIGSLLGLVPEIHFHVGGTLSNQQTTNKSP